METRFRPLRLLAGIYVVIGLLTIGLGIFAVLLAFGAIGDLHDQFAPGFAVLYGLGVFLGLFMAGLTLVGYGQFIQVVLQIEENTRIRG